MNFSTMREKLKTTTLLSCSIFSAWVGIIDVRDNPDDAIDEQVEQERLDDDAAAWEAFFEE